MATLYIKEYTHIARDINGSVIQAGLEDGTGTNQTVTTSGTTAQSAAFQTDTTLIRVVSTGIEHLEFGTNPTAVVATSAVKIEADTPEFFGVVGGQKLAAINGS